MGHGLRPNIDGLVVPPENAEKSFLERPVRSVVIQNELVVLHVIRQLPIRHQTAPPAYLGCLHILLLGVILMSCGGLAVRVVMMVVGCFIIHFPSFSPLPNRPFSPGAHVLQHQRNYQTKMRPDNQSGAWLCVSATAPTDCI